MNIQNKLRPPSALSQQDYHLLCILKSKVHISFQVPHDRGSIPLTSPIYLTCPIPSHFYSLQYYTNSLQTFWGSEMKSQ